MKVDKQERKFLKQMTGDVFVASRAVDGDYFHYNGVTVAYKPAVTNSNCRMLEVSVAYCAPEDTYKSGIGKAVARRKFIGNELVKMPLAEFFRKHGPIETGSLLLDMFNT